MSRVQIIKHGRAELVGRAGTIWRTATGGQSWVDMDDELPADLVSFPAGDRRHRMLLLEEHEIRGIDHQRPKGASVAVLRYKANTARSRRRR